MRLDPLPSARKLALRVVAVALVAIMSVGCRSFFPEEAAPSASILQAAKGAADGVKFEVYWANLPPELEDDPYETDPSHRSALWNYIQEERLDERTRRRLGMNGLRAGVVGGVPPKAIVKLLDPLGEGAKKSADPQANEDAPQTLSPTTGVRRQVTTVRPDRPTEINASEVIGRTTLLLADEGGPWGEPFERVQAIYRLGVELSDSGGVVTTLTPELHYGEPKMGWTADDTGLIHRPKPMRDRRVFSDLRIEAPLVVGEMLIVTSLPGRDSQLGGLFHRAEEGADGQRKAIVVRIVQAPPSLELTATRGGDTRPAF